MTAPLSQLQSQVQALFEQSQLLHDYLLQEKQALDQQDYSQLLEIAPRKQQQVETLQQLEQNCKQLCGSQSIHSRIMQAADRPLIQLWNNTQKLVKNCQQQNDVNGLLIQRSSQINQATLSILTGKSPQQEHGQTYNAKGSQHSGNSILNDIKA